MAGLHFVNMIERSWRSTLPSLLPSPLDRGLGDGDGLGLADGDGLGDAATEGEGLATAAIVTVAFLFVCRILALSELRKMFEGSTRLMAALPLAFALKTIVVMVAFVLFVLKPGLVTPPVKDISPKVLLKNSSVQLVIKVPVLSKRTTSTRF